MVLGPVMRCHGLSYRKKTLDVAGLIVWSQWTSEPTVCLRSAPWPRHSRVSGLPGFFQNRRGSVGEDHAENGSLARRAMDFKTAAEQLTKRAAY